MIPQSFIEELKLSADIESVVSSYVQLRRRGRILTGLCPLHSEKTVQGIRHALRDPPPSALLRGANESSPSQKGVKI